LLLVPSPVMGEGGCRGGCMGCIASAAGILQMKMWNSMGRPAPGTQAHELLLEANWPFAPSWIFPLPWKVPRSPSEGRVDLDGRVDGEEEEGEEEEEGGGGGEEEEEEEEEEDGGGGENDRDLALSCELMNAIVPWHPVETEADEAEGASWYPKNLDEERNASGDLCDAVANLIFGDGLGLLLFSPEQTMRILCKLVRLSEGVRTRVMGHAAYVVPCCAGFYDPVGGKWGPSCLWRGVGDCRHKLRNAHVGARNCAACRRTYCASCSGAEGVFSNVNTVVLPWWLCRHGGRHHFDRCETCRLKLTVYAQSVCAECQDKISGDLYWTCTGVRKACARSSDAFHARMDEFLGSLPLSVDYLEEHFTNVVIASYLDPFGGGRPRWAPFRSFRGGGGEGDDGGMRYAAVVRDPYDTEKKPKEGPKFPLRFCETPFPHQRSCKAPADCEWIAVDDYSDVQGERSVATLRTSAFCNLRSQMDEFAQRPPIPDAVRLFLWRSAGNDCVPAHRRRDLRPAGAERLPGGCMSAGVRGFASFLAREVCRILDRYPDTRRDIVEFLDLERPLSDDDGDEWDASGGDVDGEENDYWEREGRGDEGEEGGRKEEGKADEGRDEDEPVAFGSSEPVWGTSDPLLMAPEFPLSCQTEVLGRLLLRTFFGVDHFREGRYAGCGSMHYLAACSSVPLSGDEVCNDDDCVCALWDHRTLLVPDPKLSRNDPDYRLFPPPPTVRASRRWAGARRPNVALYNALEKASCGAWQACRQRPRRIYRAQRRRFIDGEGVRCETARMRLFEVEVEVEGAEGDGPNPAAGS
jgi:hypothetical protein